MQNRPIAIAAAKTLAIGFLDRARHADAETAADLRATADALNAIATGLCRNTPTADRIATDRLNAAFDMTGHPELLAIGVLVGLDG